MRCDSYLQFRIVAAQTFTELTEKLNETLYELRQKDPEVEFDGLTARIRYREYEYTPEDLREEYSLKGVDLHCQDCPFFEPLRNKNGSINRAAKRGDCIFAEYGFTSRDARACERFFKMLNNGDLRVVKGEEVEEC